MKRAARAGRFLLALTLLVWASAATEVSAVSLNPGDVLVVDPGALPGYGRVIRVDPVTKAQTTVSTGGMFNTPYGIAFQGGKIYVADPGALSDDSHVGIIRLESLSGGIWSQAVLSSGNYFQDPRAIALDAAGQIYVADPFGANPGGIIRVDPDTGVQTLLSSSGLLVDPFAIAVHGGQIFVADANAGVGFTGAIIRLDPPVPPGTSWTQTLVSSGGYFDTPAGIALDAAGRIFVTDYASSGGPALIRLDPPVPPGTSWTQTLVSSDLHFVTPIGIALDSAEKILIADQNALGGLGAIIWVNPATGVQIPVFAGGSFVEPTGVAVIPGGPPVPPVGVPEPGTLLLLGAGLAGLVARGMRRRRSDQS